MDRNIHGDTFSGLHIDNRSLVEECLKGDRDALNLFYTRFAPKMLAVIRRYVGDAMDAEDILHDGFIVAFTRLNTLRDYDHVDYWLATIMKNLSLQFLRLQDVASMLHEIPETEDTPPAEDILDMATLESLIRELPAGYRNVFRLAVLENKSHKEIARILGISPATSSSQLFRARMMMQKLIKDYRAQAGALVLLLISIPAAIFLTTSRKEAITEARAPQSLEAPVSHEAPSSVPAISSRASSALASPAPAQTAALSSGAAQAALVAPAPVEPSDSVSGPVAEPGNQLSAQNEKPVEKPESESPAHEGRDVDDGQPLYVAYPLPAVGASRNDSRWAMALNVKAGIGNSNMGNGGGNDSAGLPSVPPGSPGDIGNGPNDGDDPDSDKKDPDTEPSDMTVLKLPTRSGASFRDYKSVRHRNSMPITVSMLVSRRFTGAFSAETGITYTYLHTEFDGTRSTADCRWHYIGIPIRFKFRLFSASRFSMYASAGGAIDIPVYSSASVSTPEGTPDLESGRFRSYAVWSVTAGLGASVRLSNHLEIFIEPTFNYHFRHRYNVPNSWTDNPAGFSLPIGLRFNM